MDCSLRIIYCKPDLALLYGPAMAVLRNMNEIVFSWQKQDLFFLGRTAKNIGPRRRSLSRQKAGIELPAELDSLPLNGALLNFIFACRGGEKEGILYRIALSIFTSEPEPEPEDTRKHEML